MSQIELTPDLISLLESSFAPNKDKKVETKPCRIKFNGKFVFLKSGKSIWRCRAHASNALLGHLNSVHFPKYLCGPYGYAPSKTVHEVKDLLESQGIVEYVEVEMQEFAERRRRI